MNKIFFIIGLLTIFFSACSISPADGNCANSDDESCYASTDNSGNTSSKSSSSNSSSTVTMPSCFVYYKGATFTYLFDFNGTSKRRMNWVVTDYESTSTAETATISVTYSDETPDLTMYIRHSFNGYVEFSYNATNWFNLNNPKEKIKFVAGASASLPKDLYGHIEEKIYTSTITTPDGKSSNGFVISSVYDNAKGDSYIYDNTNLESWSEWCGLTSYKYHYSNGKEYPISTYEKEMKLVAFNIPMPDGSVRRFMSDNANPSPVVLISAQYTKYTPSSLYNTYNAIRFEWSDYKNKDVYKYNLYHIYKGSDSKWRAYKIGFEPKRWDISGAFKTASDASTSHSGYWKSVYNYDSEYLPEGYHYFAITAETIYGESPLIDDGLMYMVQPRVVGIKQSLDYTFESEPFNAPDSLIYTTESGF